MVTFTIYAHRRHKNAKVYAVTAEQYFRKPRRRGKSPWSKEDINYHKQHFKVESEGF
jgi:hypothetical protein